MKTKRRCKLAKRTLRWSMLCAVVVMVVMLVMLYGLGGGCWRCVGGGRSHLADLPKPARE